MPSDATVNYPTTLDLNGHVAVRSKAPDQTEPTELVLTSSRPAGEPFCCALPRDYLARTARLGLRDIHFFGEAVPVLCRDARRAYVWGPLAKDCIVKPSPKAILIESPTEATVAPANEPATPSKETPVSIMKSDTSQPAEQTQAAPSSSKRRRVRAEMQTASKLSPMEQAKAIRASLRQALAQNNELIRGLKCQQRQARLVASTLDSLKQLKVA